MSGGFVRDLPNSVEPEQIVEVDPSVAPVGVVEAELDCSAIAHLSHRNEPTDHAPTGWRSPRFKALGNQVLVQHAIAVDEEYPDAEGSSRPSGEPPVSGLGFDNHNPVRREASPADPLTFYNYCDSGLVVCPACSIAWGWKSPIQPDGGEGLAKHKGAIARWRLKAVWSKTAT